ncbi:ankyrin repeat-containing domain protein [Pestalotiopsis sp. NC0098]|nr:ankyrin repeat-containing domain protein [Pestalotiopsis sp. NC0098]
MNAPTIVDGEEPALLIAASAGHEMIVQALLDHGEDTEIPNAMGSTPLILAAGKGHRGTVQLLLKNTANVNVRDKHGRTPLMYAARGGFPDIVEILIKHDAKVDAKTNDGDGYQTVQLLSLLVIVIKCHSLSDVSAGFITLILSWPDMLHMIVTFGLILEDWKYQFETAFIDLLIAYVTGIIPLLGPTGTFVGVDENRTFAESLICPILALPYGSVLLYWVSCPMVAGVLGCTSRLRPSRQRDG